MTEPLQTKCLITASCSEELAAEVQKDIEDSNNESTARDNGRNVSDELPISDEVSEE